MLGRKRSPRWKKILRSDWSKALTVWGAIVGGAFLYHHRRFSNIRETAGEGMKHPRTKIRQKIAHEGRKQVRRKAQQEGDRAAENLGAVKKKAARSARGKAGQLEEKLQAGLLKAREKLQEAKQAGKSFTEKMKSDDDPDKKTKGVNNLRGVNDIKGVQDVKSVRDIPSADDIPHYD